MIDIGKILGRAWHVLWNYKVLWIFGILVVLLGGGAGANARASLNGRNYGGSDGYQGHYTPGELPAFIERTNEWFDTYAQPWFDEHIAPWFATPESIIRTIIWMVVILLAIGLVFWAIQSLIRYPSETALIRMVDEYEQSGTKVGFKDGWRLGWSRRAFRLWVIDLLIGLPAMVFALILLGLGLGVAANAIQGHWQAMGGTIFALVLTAILLGLAVLLVSLFLGTLRPFFARKAALEGTSVGEALRLGWAMFRDNWQSAGLMWLVVVGLGIAFALVSIILFIGMIPVLIVTAAAGLVVATIPAGLAYWIVSLTSIAPIAWIIAVIVGMPFLLMVMFSPFLLIGGWIEVFQSSVWTLTYREIKALESVKPTPAAPAKA
jgi:hypothetical protein